MVQHNVDTAQHHSFFPVQFFPTRFIATTAMTMGFF
jgi:hypothetical protein